jgi:superfamily II DNA or RNA helicase
MRLTLSISPNGKPTVEVAADEPNNALGGSGVGEVGRADFGELSRAATDRIAARFNSGESAGLVHLATVELQTPLPAPLAYAREFAREYLTRLCHTPGVDGGAIDPLPPPGREQLAFMAMQAPPMRGLEYLNAQVLETWWTALDDYVRREITAYPGGAAAYLREKNPLWRLVGRVTFHLAENKRDETHPFAFMASYTSRLSSQGRPQHQPLSRALQEYAGTKNRAGLIALLTPISQAAERLAWVKDLVESGAVYQALAWTPRQAHALLRDLPALEESGLVVRVPDWWKRSSAPRPQVHVKIGEAAKARMGVDALLDFHVAVALGDQELGADELRELMNSPDGLVRFRGQWVELDREKLKAALEHWKRIEREAGKDGISFVEGMRLLAGTQLSEQGVDAVPQEVRQWTGISAGEWLDQTLCELRDPAAADAPPDLRASLRPYQSAGVHWLRFMMRVGLGSCLADDMGLGKTIQVLALLLHMRERRDKGAHSSEPSLLVLPASLIANWLSEMARFAPSLRVFVAHPSETGVDLQDASALNTALKQSDLVITTYGMLARLSSLRQRRWDLAILDEAQAIKNTGARQTRAVKELQSTARIALTGTPIENRLSDLWSLFDFLNPGLLGSAKAFGDFAKKIQKQEQPDYAPLRTLVAPYILRRLKTDKRIISDLPDKTEVKAFCNLSPQQAKMYEQSVRELSDAIASAEGIQRRGIVLAYLMRLKQICNHPSHWTGDGSYDPAHSGKFQRLAELCEELAERQEKALIFTQFREITQPLADHLQKIFRAPGLVLYGSTSISQRREMVESFQRDEPGGPPFFVLSLKAGGTGLNLTAASHVIHFDRWWNPAVENQATDRAFRIGQKRNVLVHKFVCRGTVEEKIDALIGEKVALSQNLLDSGGAEKLLTEMDNRELLKFVSLDIGKATER